MWRRHLLLQQGQYVCPPWCSLSANWLACQTSSLPPVPTRRLAQDHHRHQHPRTVETGWGYHSGFMVDTSQVDPGMEANTRGLIRVIFVTEELQLVDSAFVHRLQSIQKPSIRMFNVGRRKKLMKWGCQIHHGINNCWVAENIKNYTKTTLKQSYSQSKKVTFTRLLSYTFRESLRI